jgi:hypothetical protein
MIARSGMRQREHLLSLWARDRLAKRETVSWAIDALMKIRGRLGSETVPLFEFLDSHATQNANLSQEVKTLWRLFHEVARESTHDLNYLNLFALKDKIQDGTVRKEDMDVVVNSTRPRLRAKELSDWMDRKQQESTDERPLAWVHWNFETVFRSSDLSSTRLGHAELSKLSTDILSHLLERGTSALKDALASARAIDWLNEERDLPNLLVHRVFIPKEAEGNPSLGDEDEDDDADADKYNDNFVPLVRLIGEAFDVLKDNDPVAATRISASWRDQTGGLFVRLSAFSLWFRNTGHGMVVASFLRGLEENAFWRWMVFPEVATLRALRWADLQPNDKADLETRLLAGPTNQAFPSEEDAPKEEIEYHRDHELARLVDAGVTDSDLIVGLVQSRRQRDDKFPRLVTAVETGLPGARVTWVPEGHADKFDDVHPSKLLEELANDESQFGMGNDAEALAKTPDGKRRILDALINFRGEGQFALKGWNLLLSYAHEKSEDASADSELVEAIARAALALPSPLFSAIADRLSYWIDAADEKVPRFEGAHRLWFALLPYAAQIAEDKASSPDQDGTGIDLTSAALNEPLGHLLSFFLRRCPTIPKEDTYPILPQDFVVALRKLKGRARELLVNRMAIQMNYFSRADRAWLDEFVIRPMLTNGIESDRIWEGVAKYSAVPRSVWSTIQLDAFKRLSSPQLSPEARRRLAEMCVILWVWSKNPQNSTEVDTANLRTAFGLANDDVRSAAAWQFATLFRSKIEETEPKDGEKDRRLWPQIGEAFFEEVWPLEPALQSAQSSKDFARIPASVGLSHFARALDVILPFLQPFEVWDVHGGFDLDIKQAKTEQIISAYPDETLTLLAASISEHQQHFVFDLGGILSAIVAARPQLQRDHRMRFLRKLAKQ